MDGDDYTTFLAAFGHASGDPEYNPSADLDEATLTAIALDEGFNEIYAKQVSSLGHPGDVLLTLSVNGNAGNIVAAIEAAQERHRGEARGPREEGMDEAGEGMVVDERVLGREWCREVLWISVVFV